MSVAQPTGRPAAAGHQFPSGAAEAQRRDVERQLADRIARQDEFLARVRDAARRVCDVLGEADECGLPLTRYRDARLTVEGCQPHHHAGHLRVLLGDEAVYGLAWQDGEAPMLDTFRPGHWCGYLLDLAQRADRIAARRPAVQNRVDALWAELEVRRHAWTRIDDRALFSDAGVLA